MWQFSETIDGIAEACTALNTPITGGNVSFYNETLGKSIYPTPVIGVLGVIEDASHVQKIAFRQEGHTIVRPDGPISSVGAQHAAPLLGTQREFSSSEYSMTIASIVAGEPPAIELAAENRMIDCLRALSAEGALQSAHDISDGGLAVTLAESCFASVVAGLQTGSYPAGARSAHLGATLNFADDPAPAEAALFNERGAPAVVSATPSKLAARLAPAPRYNVATHQTGQVPRGEAFRIEYKGRAETDSC